MIFLFSDNRSLFKVLVQSPLENALYFCHLHSLTKSPTSLWPSQIFKGAQPMGLKPNRFLLASPNDPCSFIGQHAG